MDTRLPSDRLQPQRTQRARDVAGEVLRRRALGEAVPDELVLAQHQELLPELADELRKLQMIGSALAEAADRQWRQAAVRLEADLAQDRSAADAAACPWPGSTDSSGSAAGRERASDPIPDRIGRYCVIGLIAEGGFGCVYRARDESLDREVAIKVPHRHRLLSSLGLPSQLSEAKAAAALDHPGIVPVYDVGPGEGGSWYLVSKLIAGEDLRTRLERGRPSPHEAARIVMVVAEALEYAHARGLVHRDIKPANILLDCDGQPHVTDFGLALRDDQPGKRRRFAGTPAYMSPEQARGEAHRVDGRSDIFSLGVVFYELLTGRKPFEASSHRELLEQIIETPPLPPRHWEPSLDASLERICLKALSKRAADRYASAAELADDLRLCRQSAAAGPITAVPRGPAAQAAAESEPGEGSVRIVPKGLRAFDAGDADFFLALLPGPRDRNGLPDSIRHWKHRIEHSGREETFSIGVLYGPSGCGKSSLVRAGLLPRLAPRVQAVYVESTGDDTEARIRKRLLAACPDLPAEAELADLLACLRRGQGLRPGAKLLLVLDQFEQWLHGRVEQERRQLVRALRQCDGQRLQCLLMVRDDFWVALSRLLAELEIDLVQGHNSTLVDLFDLRHARQVLADFGRAYGRLPEAPAQASQAQQEFLDQAVAGLANHDKVVPVRLALFAEMVKHRPWTPATLGEVGGAEGVGAAFLEDIFGAATANPLHRLHARAARSVLEALLPEASSEIKGRVRSYPELLDVSGYGDRPRVFKELVQILDAETRLLTPAEPEIAEQESPARPAPRYYQLTHDYLVPSLRNWLNQHQQATRSGRAELCLAERTALWNRRPEGRQLPSLREWLAIRLLTRRDQWTPAQREMMRTAARRRLRVAAAALLLGVSLLLAGPELTSLARRLVIQVRARSALFWVAVGQERAVWPLLEHSADPSLRTRVVHALNPAVIDAEQLLTQQQQQDDVSVRRAMLLIAGDVVNVAERRMSAVASLPGSMIARLADLYRDDPDPGVRAAAEWTLRRFEQAELLESIDAQLASVRPDMQRQWYVNRQGHTMVVLPGPAVFTMGSRLAGPGDDEFPHRQRIPRSFSIAGKETTQQQFQQFLREHPALRSRPAVPAGSPALPQASVTWYEAAAYCNWLSQKESLPSDQWCYEPNDQGLYDAGMRLATDWITRQGYRLPTEAEWEYACRAGAATQRFFADDTRHLPDYAVFGENSRGTPAFAGSRKPNDFGLFDTLGSLAEWCQDAYTRYGPEPSAARPPSAADDGQTIAAGIPRVLRGGSFSHQAEHVRCAARDRAPPEARRTTTGFRIARSYP